MLGSLPEIPARFAAAMAGRDSSAIETSTPPIEPVSAWQSARPARIRVRRSLQKDVDDPVIGIMIRTRIGIEVYGTNTELEKLKTRAVHSRRYSRGHFRLQLRSVPAVLYHYGGVARPGWCLARLDGRRGRILGRRHPVHRRRSEPARARHLLSRMNVGASPETVEKPFAPTGVTHVEQPFTLPRNECG